jgi:hypothetical protein
MPSLRFAQAQAVSTTVVNLIAGSKFEFLPVPSMVEVYGVSDQLDTSCELTLGNVIEFDQMLLPQFAIASGGPNIQDHRLGGGVGAAGDRVVFKVVTVTACAAGGLRVLFVITPV